MKSIHIIVSTHQGKIYDENSDYIVVKKADGEFAIFPDHVPTITSFNEGFIKLVLGKDSFYICLVNAALEFHDNNANVIAQEAFIGKDMEKAKSLLLAQRNKRLSNNRKYETEIEINERKLQKAIKEAHAGDVK